MVSYGRMLYYVNCGLVIILFRNRQLFIFHMNKFKFEVSLDKNLIELVKGHVVHLTEAHQFSSFIAPIHNRCPQKGTLHISNFTSVIHTNQI